MSGQLSGQACRVFVSLSVAVSAACSNETRPVGADLPQTPPSSATDPRIDRYQYNAYQVSQGSRYYVWYGCGACHASHTGSGPDLASGRWLRGNAFDTVYASISQGHANQTGQGSFGDRIPAEQLWQITAYVRSLPDLDAPKRRRQDVDLSAEAHGRQGPGGRP